MNTLLGMSFLCVNGHSFNCCTFHLFSFGQSAVHRSFAIADNLGEVSAKAQVGFRSDASFSEEAVNVIVH